MPLRFVWQITRRATTRDKGHFHFAPRYAKALVLFVYDEKGHFR